MLEFVQGFPQSLGSIDPLHGYLVLFFGILLENAGIPLPGETALFTASFFASPGSGGHLNLWIVMIVAACGAMLGDNLGYWMGRGWARKRIERNQRFLFLTKVRLKRAEYFFEKYGALTVFFGRFIALLRIVAGPAAGVSGMAWWRFFIANAAGAIVWAIVIGLLGYYAGGAWGALHRWLGNAAWILAGIVVLVIVAWHFVPFIWKKEPAAITPPKN
ncbi:MAG TPA: DedA family protein [Urbifossiella sp.]|jgi:membrane-associated protein